MSKPRKRPANQFIALMVKPTGDFNPQSWKEVPENYHVIEYIGPKQFRGRADAWRFLENKSVLDDREKEGLSPENREIPHWAVIVQ